MSHGILSPLVVHNRLPFQPVFGSSMRPSEPPARNSSNVPSIRWTSTTGTYGGAGFEIREESRSN